MTAHVLETHKLCTEPGHCRICDGGLAVCTVCNGAEGSLPTECPGRRMTAVEQDQVYASTLDFREGAWVVLCVIEARIPLSDLTSPNCLQRDMDVRAQLREQRMVLGGIGHVEGLRGGTLVISEDSLFGELVYRYYPEGEFPT